MHSPLDDTIWASLFGSVAAVQAAFDRCAPDYHLAILESGVPYGAAEFIWPYIEDNHESGIDFGCGSGVLGMGLRSQGFCGILDGIDVSPVMLNLARETQVYRHLIEGNLMEEESWPRIACYQFVISMGLVGDYIPYYLALPKMVECLELGGILGLAVEQRSTPHLALSRKMKEVGLEEMAATELVIAPAQLEGQTYEFVVAQKVSKGCVL